MVQKSAKGCDGSYLWLNQLMLIEENTIGLGPFRIPFDYFELLINFASDSGHLPEKLLLSSDISQAQFIGGASYVRNETYNEVINSLLNLSKDPYLPWKFGKEMSSHSHGVLGLVMRSAPTLLHAYDLLPRIYATRNGYSQAISVDLGRLYFDVHFSSARPNITNQIHRFNIISSLVMFVWLGRKITGTTTLEMTEEICVSWAEPSLKMPEGILPSGAKMSYSKKSNYIRYQKSQVAMRVLSASTSLQTAAITECERLLATPPDTNIVDQVQWIMQLLGPPLPTIEVVSGYLNTSIATLKRKLNTAGTSFQEVKNAMRFERVEQLLTSTELTLEAIAEEVGFNNASNLAKAFKMRFGMTPGQYRDSASS